jgi:hypothetical protein
MSHSIAHPDAINDAPALAAADARPADFQRDEGDGGEDAAEVDEAIEKR